jgi:hypothetical protein|tara:strand:- start:625 stop:804 length:180 start_codon:yes stop_codon:yes gene_type:complete
MKIGDLVKVSIPNIPDLFGIMLGRKRRYEPGKSPLVRVSIGTREHLFEYCSLEVISENR